MKAAPFPMLMALAFSACQPGTGDGVAQGKAGAASLPTFAERPVGDAGAERAGACWAVERRAAVVETVEQTVLVEPPGLGIDGTLRTEPLTRVETRQEMLQPASEVWFETLCPGDLTPARIASLQRALAVRGLYTRPVTGALDSATGAAVRAYQSPLGLESATLSRAAAERLGLVVTPLSGADAVGPE